MELVLQEPQLQLQPSEPSRWKKIKAWLYVCFARRNERDHYVSRIAAGSTALFASIAMLTAVLGMPTGFGVGFDIIIFLIVNTAAMSLSTILLAFVFNLIFLPLPRRLTAVWTYTAIETYLILYFSELGILASIIVAIIFSLTGVLVGCLFGFLMKTKIKRWGKLAFAMGAALIVVSCYIAVDWQSSTLATTSDDILIDGDAVDIPAMIAPNPAELGKYAIQTFTYGSGQDNHRKIFGDEVDVYSDTVDASAYLDKWSALKKMFWSFDERALPLNGRVWMPEAEGNYPIALIVHGNHLMEDFSDGGYRYLGELLASQGIIAVSVDENFLNYSVWSGIPNDDMKMRAWVLLKHLQEIKKFNEVEGNPFMGKVDLKRVALVGHSRGGQAVAMAANAERWFKDDKTLDSLEGIEIQSVVAIAPTDKQVDDKSARLSNVNYLTLQGARDADVNNFYGDRQFNRTTFDEPSDRFKASLYIADANHSQFNSEWGRMDERPPIGLFFNREDLLEAEEQRQISKVYISAFLQSTLLGKEIYKPLFEDYRLGLDWLPQTAYFNRYESSAFTEIARYDDGKLKTLLKDGGKATVTQMKEWKIESAEDRDGNNKGTKGITLEWTEPGAEYELEISPSLSKETSQLSDENLVFSMANLERDLIADEQEEDASDKVIEELEQPPLPDIEIQLTMIDGERIEVELNEYMPVAPPVYTSFMTIPWFEERVKDEKYKEATEPVFQTYSLPLDQFGSESHGIEADEISRITFRFVNGPGKVMLDDIGFMP